MCCNLPACSQIQVTVLRLEPTIGRCLDVSGSAGSVPGSVPGSGLSDDLVKTLMKLAKSKKSEGLGKKTRGEHHEVCNFDSETHGPTVLPPCKLTL